MTLIELEKVKKEYRIGDVTITIACFPLVCGGGRSLIAPINLTKA